MKLVLALLALTVFGSILAGESSSPTDAPHQR